MGAIALIRYLPAEMAYFGGCLLHDSNPLGVSL